MNFILQVNAVKENVADGDIDWPYHGCYEFEFAKTIFFKEPAVDSFEPGCKSCAGESKIAFWQNLRLNDLVI